MIYSKDRNPIFGERTVSCHALGLQMIFTFSKKFDVMINSLAGWRELNIKDLGYVQKIGQILKTSMWDYGKMSTVTYPFYFINWQSTNKTSCMQTIVGSI